MVDPHGNTMSLFYERETNNYALNMGRSLQPYTRGGVLLRAEYGTRAGQSGTAPARVVFDTADRCVPGANCAQRTAQVWPPPAARSTASATPETATAVADAVVVPLPSWPLALSPQQRSERSCRVTQM